MDRYRLPYAIMKHQLTGKRKPAPTLKRLLGCYTETAMCTGPKPLKG